MLAILVVVVFTLDFSNIWSAVSTVTNTVSETTTMGLGSTTTVTRVEISMTTLSDTVQEIYPGTTTQFFNIPCSNTASANATESSANSFPNFSSLLGNFSQMTVFIYLNSSIATFLTSSFDVLNRTSMSSQELFWVNVTTTIDQPSLAIAAGSGNQTTMTQSMLASVTSNGTVNSANNETGYSGLSLFQQQMSWFSPFNLKSFPPNNSVVINTTTINIGTTTMNVTNYAAPSTVILENMSCSESQTDMVSYEAVNPTMQAGIVPGTSFTLLTMYVVHVSIGQNMTSSVGSPEVFEEFKVVSFSKA